MKLNKGDLLIPKLVYCICYTSAILVFYYSLIGNQSISYLRKRHSCGLENTEPEMNLLKDAD